MGYSPLDCKESDITERLNMYECARGKWGILYILMDELTWASEGRVAGDSSTKCSTWKLFGLTRSCSKFFSQFLRIMSLKRL